MSTKDSTALRAQLIDAMRGHQAHIDFDSAVKDFPSEARGTKPSGAPHTAWQLLEHMRIAQHDILEFSRNPQHKSPKWPEGYWPKSDAPPDEKAWDQSVKAFQRDARELNKLVESSQQDLFKAFEHGEGQTFLREALLVATHNSYHLGQLVFVKKMLTGNA
jgi:DinB superfamily